MGRRRIKITVCNVPIALNEEVLVAYLIKYGNIEAIDKAKSTNGTAHGDYVFTMCLDRGGFTAIPHTISYEDRAMTVVVEGRKPQCWNCKQLGHFSKSCPQKTTKTTPTTTTPKAKTTTTIAAAAAAAAAEAATVAEPSETSKDKTGDSPNKEEGWTQVVKGGKKKKTPIKEPAKQTPIKEPATATVSNKPNITTTAKIDSSNTPTTSTAKPSSSSTSTKSSSIIVIYEKEK